MPGTGQRRQTARGPRLDLEVESAPAAPAAPTMPWWLAAAVGPLLAALAGWAIVACPVVAAQLAGASRVDAGGFTLATQFWLLAHGGPAVIDGLRVSLAPLGVTLLAGLMLRWLAAHAVHQAILSYGAVGPSQTRRRNVVLTVAVAMAAVYAVAVASVAIVVDPGGPASRAIAGAAGLAAVGTLTGAWAAAGWRPARRWPPWARAIPRAALSACVIVLLGGVTATVASLIAHRAMIAALTEQLGAGAVGTVALTLLQAAYLPNVVIWAAAWTTGAGFSLGGDSMVVLMGHHVGALPSLPLIGALPAITPAPWPSLLWLAWGALAGVVAAVSVGCARPRARADETALVGGLSGLAAGLLFTALALIARGDLGGGDLAGLGPLPLELAVLSATVMGVAGTLAGLLLGLLRPPPPEAGPGGSLGRAGRPGAPSGTGLRPAGPPPAGESQVGASSGVGLRSAASPSAGLWRAGGRGSGPRPGYGVADAAGSAAGGNEGEDMAPMQDAARLPWWRRLRPSRNGLAGGRAADGEGSTGAARPEAPGGEAAADEAWRDSGVRRVASAARGGDEITGRLGRRLPGLADGPEGDGRTAGEAPGGSSPSTPQDVRAQTVDLPETAAMSSPFADDPGVVRRPPPAHPTGEVQPPLDFGGLGDS